MNQGENGQEVGEPDPERSRAVATVIEHVRSARANGECLDDHAIISAHPDLMPELGRELEKLARIEAAWAAAETSAAGAGESVESVVPSEASAELACAVAADLERPAIEVPGYSVLREIGHGGQAVVFLAVKLNPGRRVALKVIRDASVAGEYALARFHREAAVLAKLNHPNIVNVFETGRTADGRHYFTMNYIAGCGLGEYLLARRNNDLDDPGRLLRLFFRICEVVNTAHKAKVVHRDLKPANIRIDERGEPHILDFGLARSTFDRAAAGWSTGAASDETISVTGEFLGSLPWCSPEQVAGDPGRIDVRTDVYSLGVILYQMLTGGRFPYEVVGNIRDVLNNIVMSEPTPPSKVIAAVLAKESAHRDPARTHLPAVNDEIEKIVLKALAKHPEDRYANAGQLGTAIADYLLGRKAAGREAEPRRRLRKKARWPIAVIAGIGALLIVAYIVRQPTRRAPPRLMPVSRAGPSKVAMAGVNRSLIVTASNQQPAAPTTSTFGNDGRVVDLLPLIDAGSAARPAVANDVGARHDEKPPQAARASPAASASGDDLTTGSFWDGSQENIWPNGATRSFSYHLTVIERHGNSFRARVEISGSDWQGIREVQGKVENGSISWTGQDTKELEGAHANVLPDCSGSLRVGAISLELAAGDVHGNILLKRAARNSR